MINAIGAMHAAMRAKRRPEDETNFRVEVKRRRRKPHQNEDNEDERLRRERADRGHKA